MYCTPFLSKILNGDWQEGAIMLNIETLQEYDFMLKALFMITVCQQRFYLPQVAVLKYENNF